MVRKVKQLSPPKGFSRTLYRMPIWLFNHGLGWMLGDRFLMIHHTGRKTGLPRQAVVEVVHHDREADTYIVNAGFGSKTQWYQNLLAHPDARIQVGRRTIAVRAEQLSPQQGGEVFAEFTRRNPFGKTYAKFLGYEVDGSEEDFRSMGETMIFIALRPR